MIDYPEWYNKPITICKNFSISDEMSWRHKMLSVDRLNRWWKLSLFFRERTNAKCCGWHGWSRGWPLCRKILSFIHACKLYTDNYLYLRMVSYRSPLAAAVLAFMWPYPELSSIITTQAERDRLDGKWWWL